ncbi:MAG: thioredoxin-dependent thiol peroxidase [Actinomycetes bacterium]|nr:thioredoxin-dependent thiol peroxidase [Actinomycetes bacterium]MDX5381031.1 thioredoxin-dependent thiol peroxidase [Actinomycetes bacterium]MDX5400199.1 thioredoxin-dependent thiol peroxidase [Actinomycetes bacterium]MDX5450785.1 thioredoxin-dependent thiol peroxidase [Actinomycetes bacterium]
MTLDAGQPAPPFVLPTADGEVSLATLLQEAESGVVVYFYPAAMTSGCTTEACDFRDSLASLTGHGYAVVGISPDSPAKLAEFAGKEGLTFPLASDPDHAVAEAYGAWGEKKLYGKVVHGIIRSTFVVAPDGTLRHAYRNVKATGHVARLRRELGID